MFQRSRILRLFLNASVTMAVVFFVVIGATHCEPETWGTHVFLPAGTKGVSWCARVSLLMAFFARAGTLPSQI
jgi:hypothetical protein